MIRINKQNETSSDSLPVGRLKDTKLFPMLDLVDLCWRHQLLVYPWSATLVYLFFYTTTHSTVMRKRVKTLSFTIRNYAIKRFHARELQWESEHFEMPHGTLFAF